jgi:hypothetical protein
MRWLDLLAVIDTFAGSSVVEASREIDSYT